MKQPTWNRESGYVYAMLGSAIGMGNILTFSGHCYRYGGGAFLFPYLIVLILMGTPLLYLEGFLGSRFRLPYAFCYAKILGNKWRFFGWLAVLVSLSVGALYMVVTGYAFAYSYFSAFGSISETTELFFKETFLSASDSLTDWGHFSFNVFFWGLLICFISWWVLKSNLQKGLERFCSFFLPLLYTLLVLFVLLIFVLPGSFSGVAQLFSPNLSRVLSPLLWRDAIGQVFFSLSLGMGIVTGLSRYTTADTQLPRAMMLVVLGDLLASLLASIAIFGCLGFVANVNGMSIGELIHLETVYELGFVVFPKIMHTIGGDLSQFIGFLFFFSLFIAGITGFFAIMESISGNLKMEFGLKRSKALLITVILLITLSLPFCMGNGLYLIQSLESMLMGDAVLMIGVIEIVSFLYLSDKITKDPVWKGSKRFRWARYMLKTASLTLLLIGLGGTIAFEAKRGFSYSEYLRWGWFFACCLVAFLITRRPCSFEGEEKSC